MRLPTPDWLHHQLTIGGTAADVGQFRQAAAGAGIIPWHLDLERMEEDYFHLLVAAEQRTFSVAGARIFARQLREAVAHRPDLAVSRVGQSRTCFFDLHALIPVPPEILTLGPDEKQARAWRWGASEAGPALMAAAGTMAASASAACLRSRPPQAGPGHQPAPQSAESQSGWRET